MIKKILIANRGEITQRIIQTCNKMGIECVTIFADDDIYLAHSIQAEVAVGLGAGKLSDTYLNQDKIIKIAKDNNCDAIHPGYGFLSENTSFCKKVSDAGLVFIGPSIESIELMGDKKESKIKMIELGIPVVPGYHGENQDPVHLIQQAKKIGYPVLIKATAGGGGKGMRIVRVEHEFNDALDASKREAMNAFSNDQVLLEKYIELPRHIEVQLVSDGKGNHFHFFERECSIQRRYQKVIEETPSCALDAKLRKKMCDTATQIASGINYEGAGTIEYILTQDNEFYFLEMNTRLQVEHPVTELVTGFDLVELQILAASKLAFNFSQKDIKQTGHSFECRIYAEDPDHDFLPTSGRIQNIETHHIESKPDYRLDCGYLDGNSISTNYDPMLAKLITHGTTRELALLKMQESLNCVVFSGVKTNRDFLKRILNHSKFKSGEIHTHFIEQEASSLTPRKLSRKKLSELFACSLVMENSKYACSSAISSKTQILFKAVEKVIIIDGDEHNLKLLQLNSRIISFKFHSTIFEFSIVSTQADRVVLKKKTRTYIWKSLYF